MAGVQWSGGKLTRSQFGAAMRHNEKGERLQREHDNEDIDKSVTHLNYSVKGLSYDERLRALDKRLSEIDTGRRSSGKNARVVAQSLIGYVPPEIEAQGTDAVREWVRGFYGCVADQVGEDNIIDCDVHFDERHEYVDPDTSEIVMSRVHAHLVFVPVTTEEERQIKEQKLGEDGKPERDARGKIRYRVVGRETVKLNRPKLAAKQVASRANITRLNKSVDDMTYEQFGVRYMTGKGKKGRRSKRVEQLKIDSAKAADAKLESLETNLEQARVAVDREKRRRDLLAGERFKTRDGAVHLGTRGLRNEIDSLEQERMQLDSQVQERWNELSNLDAQVSQRRSTMRDVWQRQRELDERDARVTEREQMVTSREETAQTMMNEAHELRKEYMRAVSEYEEARADCERSAQQATVDGVDPFEFVSKVFRECARDQDVEGRTGAAAFLREFVGGYLQKVVNRVLQTMLVPPRPNGPAAQEVGRRSIYVPPEQTEQSQNDGLSL